LRFSDDPFFGDSVFVAEGEGGRNSVEGDRIAGGEDPWGENPNNRSGLYATGVGERAKIRSGEEEGRMMTFDVEAMVAAGRDGRERTLQ